MSTADTAKVFMSGRSQAVRLPKAYRFDTDEVTIEKVVDAVVLRPNREGDDWWAHMEAILAGFEGMETVERDRGPLADDILSFDIPPDRR